MFDILILAGIVLVALLTLSLIVARLYRRASKELSFVRTGMGGQKVVINGGTLVLPILHEVIPVNMNTLRLEVKRANEQALITHDRMRVDVTAEFYVRAKPTAESIANAAQTLGLKTTKPDQLKVLVEGKFVDALRAVAAEMAMEELHEKRVDFVQKVQQVVSEDLLKNGLELESVSLTGLDQTSVEHFNPRNAFDAEGLTRLTGAIESRRKTRNEIEQDTEVEVRTKNLDAERHKLDIQRDQEYAQLSQEREIAVRKADQRAEIAIEEASKNRDAQEAEIQAKRQVEIANIDAERTVEEQRIARQQAVSNREIERDRLVETARIEQKKTIELADQDRTIAVAERSKAQSEAESAANQARAAAVREEERVATARDVEVAERTKQVELVDARKAAERDAISIEVKAEAEKRAATDQAEAVRTRAQADADRQRIAGQGLADAEILQADAAERRYAVDAEGKRHAHEADNLLSNEQISMQVRMELIEQLPAIIRESVKPMEQIDGIKIFQVDGLAGNGTAAADGGGNLADQIVNSALRYRAQAPLLDTLLSELGLDPSSVRGLTQSLDVTEVGSVGNAKVKEDGSATNGGQNDAAVEDGSATTGEDTTPE